MDFQIAKHRRKKKSTSSIELMAKYVELVRIGLKPAYLVDNCVVSLEEVCALVASINREFESVSALARLKVLVIDMDIFVVNMNSFQRIYADLVANDWSQYPVVLNLGSSVTFVDPDELIIIGQHLRFVFEPFLVVQSDVFTVIVTDTIRNFISLPFIAGWLLNYSCLYRAMEGSSALSSLALLKITISVDHREATAFDACCEITFAIMEFTVPDSCFTNRPTLKSEFFRINHLKLSNVADSLKDVKAGDWHNYAINSCVLTYPHVVL